LFCSWDQRDDFNFYLPYVMSADTVLDVGCGTGALLHGARAHGHRGRLCGIDPADAMLDIARVRSDIDWVLGDMASAGFEADFDLIVMTGHAFQVFVEDDELCAALDAIRSALTSDGRFVFETRNPVVREWERWTAEHAAERISMSGAVVRMTHEVEIPIDDDRVSFTVTYTSPDWDRARVSRSTLRFLDNDALSGFLADAGLAIVEQFGDWDARPRTDASPEIITVAQRSDRDRTRRLG
jgi:SAM-dependent methyltransferase